jgi:hypothetical protein
LLQVTWLAYISTYIHVFKTHYLVVNNARFYHEHSNHAYGALPYWAAEFVSTMIGKGVRPTWSPPTGATSSHPVGNGPSFGIGTMAFLPGITICYFMVGLPSEAFGFSLLTFYVRSIA